MRRPAVLLLAALVAGCGGAEPRGAPEPRDHVLAVAVAVAPHAWLVEQVCGGRARVFELVRPGESPETYQPDDAQVTRLLRAAAYFRAGVPFERGPWFDALRSSGVRIVDLGAGGGNLREDPHTWLSPRNLKLQARTVTDTLAELDPEHASEYRADLADLEARLDALDRDLRRVLEPLEGRPFFVFHPAWGHFAAAYNLRQVAIEVDGKEPSDRELTELQQQARAAGARAVFVQPQVSSRAAEAVARAVGAKLETLDPLERDVDANLRRVAEALRAAHE